MAENTAVSVYAAGNAMDDFPVLKAFQQYIDAEQAKAQKRMTTICFFFALILLVVIGVFVALLMAGAQRNNALNDQLLQVMLNANKERSAVVVQPPAPQNDAAIKALSESMSALQQQLADQQAKILEQQQKLVEEKTREAEKAKAAAAVPPQPTKEQLAMEQKLKEDAEKIRRVTAALKAEREKLAKEKELLKQKEIELQRRKLYPELYDDNGNRKRYVPPKEKPEPKKASPAKVRVPVPVVEEPEDDDEPDELPEQPVKYFDDWDVPLE